MVAATFIVVWLGILAAQASPGPNMFAVAETARFWRVIEAVVGTAFAAFGASLLVSGTRDLRS